MTNGAKLWKKDAAALMGRLRISLSSVASLPEIRATFQERGMLVCLRVLSSLVGRKELSHAGRGTSLRNCGAYETRLAEGGWKFINAALCSKSAARAASSCRCVATILYGPCVALVLYRLPEEERVLFFFLVACFVVLSVR